jgi:hypothetical protein
MAIILLKGIILWGLIQEQSGLDQVLNSPSHPCGNKWMFVGEYRNESESITMFLQPPSGIWLQD